MSLHDAVWAIRHAMKACEEAEDMIAAGAVGDVLRETLSFAKDLLDLAERELADVDGARYRLVVAAPPALRSRLSVLCERLGGAAANRQAPAP